MPAANYHFVSATDNGDPITPVDGSVPGTKEYKVLGADKDHLIAANFAIDQYTITALPSTNGTITPTTQSVDHGSNSATLTITPDSGHEFVSAADKNRPITTVPGAVPGTREYRFLNVTENNTIIATFAALKDVTVTATASNKVYDGTTAASVTVTSTDFNPGDDLTATYVSATFADKNVGDGKTVNVTGIALTGPDAHKYNLLNTTATAQANITAKTVTGSFTSANKVYDGTTDASATARSVAGTVTGDVVTLDRRHGGLRRPQNVGTGKTVTLLTGAVLGGSRCEQLRAVLPPPSPRPPTSPHSTSPAASPLTTRSTTAPLPLPWPRAHSRAR